MVMANGQCAGTIVRHRDGTVAACTEELEGRCCPGPGLAHAGGVVPCEAVLGRGGCETCELESWGADEWRHAAHVGALVARRCRRHRGPLVPARVAGRPGR